MMESANIVERRAYLSAERKLNVLFVKDTPQIVQLRLCSVSNNGTTINCNGES